MIRQEDLWSAPPLPLNHLRDASATQQVFHFYRMKNTWFYVTLCICFSVRGKILGCDLPHSKYSVELSIQYAVGKDN